MCYIKYCSQSFDILYCSKKYYILWNNYCMIARKAIVLQKSGKVCQKDRQQKEPLPKRRTMSEDGNNFCKDIIL